MSDLPPTSAPAPTPITNAAPPVSTDPNELALAGMFPDIEPSVIKEVLQAHSGNEERAVESLLAMTDDSFVPEVRPEEDAVSRAHLVPPSQVSSS